jgi:hypothetical protein
MSVKRDSAFWQIGQATPLCPNLYFLEGCFSPKWSFADVALEKIFLQ